MSDERFPDSVLAEVVGELLGAGPAGLSFQAIPTGKFNTSFYVEGAGRPLVLRIAPPDDPSRVLFYEHRMMRQEPALHELLRARTAIPVPNILAHRRQEPRLGRDLLLMERLDGAPISDHPGLTPRAFENVLREVGVCLRAAHRITGDRYGYLGEHRPMPPQTDWPSAFHIMWNKLLDDIERCSGYSAEEAQGMRRLLDRHARVFDRPVPAALLHMDVWAQNIMASPRGELTGLVDWDRAVWGDPEIEFAVLDYCGISEPAFWEGYGTPRDTSPEAEIRRLFYLLYELQKYIFIRRVRGRSPSSADRYRQESLRLARQLEPLA